MKIEMIESFSSNIHLLFIRIYFLMTFWEDIRTFRSVYILDKWLVNRRFASRLIWSSMYVSMNSINILVGWMSPWVDNICKINVFFIIVTVKLMVRLEWNIMVFWNIHHWVSFCMKKSVPSISVCLRYLLFIWVWHILSHSQTLLLRYLYLSVWLRLKMLATLV